jgi:hypothetical protein
MKGAGVKTHPFQVEEVKDDMLLARLLSFLLPK